METLNRRIPEARRMRLMAIWRVKRRLSILLLLAFTQLAHAQSIPQGNGADIAYWQSSTWSPTDGSGAGLTFSNVSASYTQIGNLVFAYAALTYPTTADETNAQINGLPIVTSPPTNNYAAICSVTVSLSNPSNWTLGTIIQVQKSGNNVGIFQKTGWPMSNASMSALPISIMCIFPAS